MIRTHSTFWPVGTATSFHLADEAVSLLIGAGITAGLFLTMAHFGHGGRSQPVTEIADLRPVAMPLEAPPPTVIPVEPEPAANAITGIDVAAAESPVHIAVSPPPLESLPVPLAPPARIQTSTLVTEFKPKMDLNNGFSRVFQTSEVDQRPSVLVNTSPFVPHTVRRGAEVLRVVLLMVIDAKGVASDIRVLQTSGNREFDALIGRCVQDEWVFSPAIKKGRKVKCLVQRTITVRWTGTPFES